MSSEQNQIKTNEEVVSELAGEGVSDELADKAEVGDKDDSKDANQESLEQQLEQAQATIANYWDQIVRLKAEMENNRKRASRDIENAHKFALRNFSEALLPVVDSMEMGQKAAEADNASLSSIVEGTEMTMSIFISVLEKHGLKQTDPVGEVFDPQQHQAISMIEDENVQPNTVISVLQKGFLLNDRLVRPAMVVVAK